MPEQTPEEQIAILNNALVERLARDLAFDALALALIDTHHDRPALLAAFEKRIKDLNAVADTRNPTAMNRMRPIFDKACDEIVSVIRAPKPGPG